MISKYYDFLYIHTPATMHTHAHTRKRARACAYIVQVCKWTLLAEMRLAHYPAPLLWLLPHQIRSVTLPIYAERGGIFGDKNSLRAK